MVEPGESAARGGPGRSGVGELDAAARLADGPPARARTAASVIVVRDGGSGPEVLLVKRNPQARFMGGVWVFPGGAVDAADGGEGDEAHRAAAVRELAEEAGIRGLDAGHLVKFSRWITPVELAIRFDTHFFIAQLPAGQTPVVDGSECVDQAWFTAEAGLEAHAAGTILLVLPTIRQLEQLRGFASVDELIDHVRRRAVTTTLPRLLVTDGEATGVVIPGDDAYDASGSTRA
jgi:8-oxo-dGTP pyrophosphatase MutT (NUDIX family)